MNTSEVSLHVGFDDTDSRSGGCTTYIAAILVGQLLNLGVRFIDYPNLIRLNPNVPWKTRGNGALCLRVACEESLLDEVFEAVVDTVERNSDLGCRDTDPGIVFFYGLNIPDDISSFSKRAIQSIVKMEEAIWLVKKFEAEALGFGTGYGVVGALAAIGETLHEDHTFELIAYRTTKNRGTRRQVDKTSVERMSKRTAPETFNNIDPETGRVLITPRGPDPILYGIRGESAAVVVKAHEMINALESVERWVVFRTNQGTDAHLKRVDRIEEILPNHPVVVCGKVASSPKVIPRRHRIFSIADSSGSIDCAAYEPTGALLKVARGLTIGDKLEVSGGVRPSSAGTPLTINLEKINAIELASQIAYRNPQCRYCGKRLKSEGVGKGFKCAKCGRHILDVQKEVVELRRDVSEGLFVTSPRSQRHLTKPLSRYGWEKSGRAGEMISTWHYP